MTPCCAKRSTNGVPIELRCRIVSSCRMTPLMNEAIPGVVKNISRYARRLSPVDSMVCAAKRLVIVGTVSSAARMPLPPATRARAVRLTSFDTMTRLHKSWRQARVLGSRHEGTDSRPPRRRRSGCSDGRDALRKAEDLVGVVLRLHGLEARVVGAVIEAPVGEPRVPGGQVGGAGGSRPHGGGPGVAPARRLH